MSERQIMLDKARHLICVPYSIAALHETAEKLGIGRCWYHPGRFPHYDVPRYRFAELKRIYGLVEAKVLLKVIKQFRADEENNQQEKTNVA